VIETPIKSGYLLAQISQDYWIYIGTKQAGKSIDLVTLFATAKKEPRPALLATDLGESLFFGPETPTGKIFYAGASSADFLCRVRLLENTDYYWEILSNSKAGPEIISEDQLPVILSSLSNTRRIGIRWETDQRQAKGILNFGNFLGSGWIGLKDGPQFRFEVISAKISYEDEYLALLHDLTNQSLALLFDPEAPTQGKLVETEGDQKTLLEKFLLLQVSLPLNELKAAMGMIKSRPHSQLKSEERWMPAGMTTGLHAMNDPIGRIRWAMSSSGRPIPIEAIERTRRDSTDTPPNRFIKHAIKEFQETCRAILSNPKNGNRLINLATELHTEFEQQSRLEFIKTAGPQGRIALENQVLQKRDGYRHYLRSWIISNKTLAIKDINNHGILSPTAENRQVPELYEYWLFFFLAEALEGITDATQINRMYVAELNPKGIASIILSHRDTPRLTLRLGKKGSERYVALYYNRSFRPGPGYTSYSLTLRPDYTIETFPVIYESNFEQCRKLAEKNGAITFIHFDAKFRIANLDLRRVGDGEHQEDEPSGDDAKREDVYKMHTYNEAIRGTAASVILYPGEMSEKEHLNQSFVKYRELIPGVGSLAITPGNQDARAKALNTIRSYILEALSLTPKDQSAYAQMRNWEVNELPLAEDETDPN